MILFLPPVHDHFVCVVSSLRLIPIYTSHIPRYSYHTPHSDLGFNYLTGLVPSLPFKKYTDCVLDDPSCTGAGTTHCNHFKCPLPAGIEKSYCTAHCK
jgi:hypothetical protein